MPWPMTFAPTNEAIRRENHAKKKPSYGKKTVTVREVIEDVMMVLLSKTRKIV
jgi:hypothetical protein